LDVFIFSRKDLKEAKPQKMNYFHFAFFALWREIKSINFPNTNVKHLSAN